MELSSGKFGELLNELIFFYQNAMETKVLINVLPNTEWIFIVEIRASIFQ